MKNILLPIIIIIGVVILFINMTKAPKINNSTNAEVIFYYGQECQFCHNVLKYISDNKVDQKIKINSLEVYHNEQNKKELKEISRICPEIISKSGSIGVPVAFVVNENKCYTGEPDIIDKLKSMLQ